MHVYTADIALPFEIVSDDTWIVCGATEKLRHTPADRGRLHEKQVRYFWPFSKPRIESVTDLEKEFNELAERWYRETGPISMLHKKAMHPAYQRIIGMGKAALPFIFVELKQRRGHWLWALCAITGEDAAGSSRNIRQAVEAWLQWGERNGYV